MSRHVTHEDLVARALGALAEDERARVDLALERDARLRREFEEISGHLLQYDQLPPAPPPPPFERIAAVLDEDAAPDLSVLGLQTPRRRVRPRWLLPTAAAAMLVLGLGLYTKLTRNETVCDIGHTALVAGRGLHLERAGKDIPAPALGTRSVAPGDVLHCEAAAEARLGERVRLVLDGGARLSIGLPDVVTLERGRAWFEVAPGAFEVRTPYGPVRVLGTAFEVDLRGGRLEVGVAHGRVAAGGHEIGPGERLSLGTVGPDADRIGAWFEQPVLRLEAVGASPHALGQAIEMRLVFQNAGNVPLKLRGPASARTAIWLSFETAGGRVLRELPVLGTNVTAGADLLQPGVGLDLAPGQGRSLTLKILPPVGSPGAYRCRALYRPEGQPGVHSTPLDLEVR